MGFWLALTGLGILALSPAIVGLWGTFTSAPQWVRRVSNPGTWNSDNDIIP
jgi:hypothetical protein